MTIYESVSGPDGWDGRDAPVTNAASSETRNDTRFATSSGFPIRPKRLYDYSVRMVSIMLRARC